MKKNKFLETLHTLYSHHKMAIILGIGLAYFAVAALIQSYWKAEDNPPVPPVVAKILAKRAPEPQVADALTALQNQMAFLSERLLQQETAISSQASEELLTLAVVRGVLENRLSFGALKTFLQRNPTPWKHSLLTHLESIEDIKTCAYLEATLVLPPSSVPSSFFKRMEQKMRSLIHIQKQDAFAEDAFGKLLKQGMLQPALALFETLPPEDRKFLSAWCQHAQNRLSLERIENALLLSIAEGK